MTIRYATTTPPGDPFGQAISAWQEEVIEKTDGRVQFENYYSGTLLGTADMVTGLQSGVADLGFMLPSYYPDVLPVNAWIAGMGAAVSTDPARAVVANGAAAYEYLLGDTAARAEYESLGLTPLVATSSLAYHLLCNKEVSSLADAQGLRARSSGDIWTASIEQLGMTPIYIPFTDLYEAMQRGVADCAIAALQVFHDLKFDEVADHLIPVTLAQVQASTWAWNKDTWDSLDPEIQRVMHEATLTFFQVNGNAYLKGTTEAAKALTGEGGTVVIDDPGEEFFGIADQQRQDWIDRLSSRAPEGVDDPEQVIADYQARINYWNDAMDELGFPQNPTDVQSTIEAYLTSADTDLTAILDKFAEESVAATAPGR